MRNTLPKQIEDARGRDVRPLALAGETPRGLWERLARREGLLLAGFVLVGFVLRAGLLRLDSVITPDGVSYAILGWNLMEGRLAWAFSTYWPPLYPLLIGATSLLVGDLETSGRVISLVAGSLVVLPSYVLTREWYGRRVAALGALLVVAHPVLIYYSTMVLTEATYTLLFVSGVLAGWRGLTRGRRLPFALAGLCFGACYLLKPEAFGFVVLLLVITLCARLFGRGAGARATLLDSLALLAAFLLLASPYLLYLHHETGRWTISEKLYGHLFQGIARDGASPTAKMPGPSVALAQLTKSLRAEYEVVNLIFPTLSVLLAGLGLFRTRWTRERAFREVYLLLFVAATLVGYALTLPNIRYVATLLPLLTAWVAKGVFECDGWLAETTGATPAAAIGAATEATIGTKTEAPVGARTEATLVARTEARREWPQTRARRWLRAAFKPVVVLLLVLSVTPAFVYLLKGDKWSDYSGQREAGRWIRAQNAPGAAPPLVMSTVPLPAFYGRARDTRLYLDEDYPTVLGRVRSEGVDYLVINERDIKSTPLAPLLDEEHPPAELRLVHRYAAAPGHRILVYVPNRE